MTQHAPAHAGDVRAQLALWNGVLPQRQAEYERWHLLEHVPERVWVPGFVAGTRYVSAQAGQPRYFTLYELAQLDCLSSAAYQALVDQPSPWSARMRPALTDFLRKTGPLVAQAGAIQGAGLWIRRMVLPEGSAPAAFAWAAWAQQLLEALSVRCVCRVRVQAVVAAGAQALTNTDAAPAGPEWLCLVDCADPAALPSLAPLLDAAMRQLPGGGPIWQHDSGYQFASRVLHADVQAPQRPAPRLDLMPGQEQGRSA